MDRIKLTRNIALLVAIMGLILAIVSMLADFIGIGAGPNIIGWKQFTGIAVGFLMVVFGMFVYLGPREYPE